MTCSKVSVFVCLLAVTGAQAATPAQIDEARAKGLAWLIQHQRGDGSFAGSKGLEVQATAAAVEAMAAGGASQSPQYARALSWLGNVPPGSLDAQAWQITALTLAGRDATYANIGAANLHEGSAAGGYGVTDPLGSLYNPTLGTGILADPYAADTAFDALDRPVKTPDGRGHQWQTVYDANGNPLTVGLTVGGAYLDGYYAAWDDLDRLERKVDYAGNATLAQYDALGQVSQITEADGYTIGFDRDPMGRVTGAYNQEGHRVSLALDAGGRARSSTDPNNLTTQYEYHHATQDGRLKRTTLPKVTGQTQGRAVEIAQYDGAGRPLKLNGIAADGTIRDSYRFYDELGRLTRSVGPQTSGADVNRPVTCHVYSVLGDTKEIWAGSTTDTTSKLCVLDGVNVRKQLSRTFDDWGRKLTETDALGNVWKWTWNLHNQLTSSQTPTQIAAGQSTVYAYGSKGASGEIQGQVKSRTVPGTNGQTAVYTRNALGLVTHAETRNGANQLVVAYDYAYDAAKRLRSVADSRPGMGIAKEISYTWTPGGRLALIKDSDGHMASMSYDPTGRLARLGSTTRS
jgi:YD repeat-containing protein